MFAAPAYMGIAALDECLMYLDIDGLGKSLYHHCIERPGGLLTGSAVQGLRKLPDGKIRVEYRWHQSDPAAMQVFSEDFDSVVLTLVQELDRILLRCTNIQWPISSFIDHQHACVQRWVTDRNALGCARLYRPGTYHDAVSLMKYNRDLSGVSGLYFGQRSDRHPRLWLRWRRDRPAQAWCADGRFALSAQVPGADVAAAGM